MKKQVIRLTESDLQKVIKESVNSILNESYNDSQTVAKIKDLRQNLVHFIEYLMDTYENPADTDDRFLFNVYNGANKLYADLGSFLYDNDQQSLYQY